MTSGTIERSISGKWRKKSPNVATYLKVIDQDAVVERFVSVVKVLEQYILPDIGLREGARTAPNTKNSQQRNTESRPPK